MRPSVLLPRFRLVPALLVAAMAVVVVRRWRTADRRPRSRAERRDVPFRHAARRADGERERQGWPRD